MKTDDMIRHYATAKALHGALPESLTEKLAQLRHAFSGMDTDTHLGRDYVLRAYSHWTGRAPGTIRRYLVQLRAVMARCEKDGLIAKVPYIDLPYVNDTVYVDISSLDVEKLLLYVQHVEPEWYPLLLVLCHTGARLNEALAMTERNFTKHGTLISKPVDRRSKTIDRVVPYTKRMESAVAYGAILRNGGRLTPRRIADDSVPVCLGRVVKAACTALGIDELRVHDLRHAFAAILAEHGADLADLSAALGHSNTAMAMRYRGLVKSRLNGILGSI